MGKYPYKPSLALLLVSFLGLATQICSAKQHNTTTSFRHSIPERLMQNTYDIVCNQTLCKSKGLLSEPETTYRLILSGNSKANLEFDYDETKQLLINFELGDLSEPVNVTVEVWTSQDQPGIQAACEEHHVPISITESNKNKFVVTVLNPYVNSVTVPVKISFIAKPEGQQIPKWVIPVSIVGGAIILLGIIVSISCLKYSENRRLRNRYIQHSASNQSPYDIDVRYPETKLEELKSDFSQTSCAICLEDLQASQLCRQFDCQHIFHTQCAKMWLESQILKSSKAACPICNQQVMSVDPNQ